jgi:hypothetical protein
MKEKNLLVIASLLSVFFVSVHISYDLLFGFDKGGPAVLIVLPILAIWLYAILVLSERTWGYIIIILGSLLGIVIPTVHTTGAGLEKGVPDSTGGFLFIWTTIALGVTSAFSIFLSIRGMVKGKRTVGY